MRGLTPRTSRALALACAGLLLLAATPTRSVAAPIQAAANRSFHYNTSGKVYAAGDPKTVSGPALLRFDGVKNQVYYPNSNQDINLGQFVVDSTIPGQATTFDGTPFRLQIQVPELDKTSKVPLLSSVFSRFGRDLRLKTVTQNSVLLRGFLNGTVNADGSNNLRATIRSVKLGSLDPGTSDHLTKFVFPIRFGELKFPPNWTVASSAYPNSMFAAQVLATPAPEPASVLVFAAALGGLALAHHRRRAGR